MTPPDPGDLFAPAIGKPYAAAPGSCQAAAGDKPRCMDCAALERWESQTDRSTWSECQVSKSVHGNRAGSINPFARACWFFERVSS